MTRPTTLLCAGLAVAFAGFTPALAQQVSPAVKSAEQVRIAAIARAKSVAVAVVWW